MDMAIQHVSRTEEYLRNYENQIEGQLSLETQYYQRKLEIYEQLLEQTSTTSIVKMIMNSLYSSMRKQIKSGDYYEKPEIMHIIKSIIVTTTKTYASSNVPPEVRKLMNGVYSTFKTKLQKSGYSGQEILLIAKTNIVSLTKDMLKEQNTGNSTHHTPTVNSHITNIQPVQSRNQNTAPRTEEPIRETKPIERAESQHYDVGKEVVLVKQHLERIASNKGDPKSTTFGEVFTDEQVEQVFESLVGTLKAARKRGFINFEGQILLYPVHQNVVISLKY
eukprot:TRINITY_DN9415_c0_g1_i1.p1 TRINITY_DN9415_c0_g1~~TRINITY_DN9415_c0_g1_i1.p1  ORF type:complete len:277 (+),score=35.68 TRINITY_DN9415_c0_g1_i1:331-1161(+)